MARGLLVVAALALLTLGSVAVPAAEPFAAHLTLAPAALLEGELPEGTVSNGAEPRIHVTRDGSTILIGDFTGLYRSTNGGTSWQRAPDPFAPGVFADGWPIAEDDTGRIYAADTQGQIVGVASSSNRGQSWDIVSRIVAVGSIVDRPWLAARGNGEVALIVNSDRGEECYRSLDGGATWLDFSLTANPPPNPGSVSFDPQGRLWFSNGASWYMWNAPCRGAAIPRDHPDAGPQILTQTAVDSAGAVYTAVPSSNSAQMLVHARPSTGGLKTVVVSQAAQKSNTFGAIAVDNVTGDVAVAWYGSTTAGNPSGSFSGSWQVFVARIQNYWSASPTITVTQVTTEANHVGGFCMNGIGCSTGGGDRDLLDYQGVAFAPDHSIHVAYGHDGATSSAQVRYARVA